MSIALPVPAISFRHLRASHPTVYETQQALNHMGQQPPLKEDGIFGPRTRAALKAFQRKQGDLHATGDLNHAALEALNHALRMHNAASSEKPSRTPPATIQPKQLEQALIVQAIPPDEQAVFHHISQANARIESGNRFVASRLATSANAPASYGRGQLLTQLHVVALLDDSVVPPRLLDQLGIGREDLHAIDARGRITLAWYDVLVLGEDTPPASLSPQDARELHALANMGNYDQLLENFGETFAQSTGLPREELRFMAATRTLYNKDIRERYLVLRRQYGRDQGLVRLAGEFPAITPLLERVEHHLDIYLTRLVRREHRGGWYTRAAQLDPPQFERFIKALEQGGDHIRTTRRHIKNYQKAMRVASQGEGFATLDKTKQARLLGQMARIYHGSPRHFATLFGSARNPAMHDVSAIQARLDALIGTAPNGSIDAQRGRSLRRWSQAFDSISRGA